MIKKYNLNSIWKCLTITQTQGITWTPWKRSQKLEAIIIKTDDHIVLKLTVTRSCWLFLRYSNLDLHVTWYGKLHGAFNKFPDFFCTGIQNCHRLLKIHYVIAIHLMRWLANFYDFRFKWTATAAIGIHPFKAWLSQLVNFKNAIWTRGHFRRTICNKILF